MRKPIFKGAATALVTPFCGERRGEEVNYGKLGELLEFQIANGIDCIVICGTTGEASTLPDDEHVAVARYAVEKVAGRVPVIAGAGSNDTRHAIELSVALESIGADGLLLVTPYYNKTTQTGIVAHFAEIAKAVRLPIIVYNVPARTNLNIAPDTLAELSRIENIVGVKECNFDQVGESRNKCEPDFMLYSGEDANVLPLLAMGGFGVISTIANILPRETHDLCARFFAGDLEGARELQLKEMQLVRALFCEVNPIPLKEAMNMLGHGVGHCRLPLVDMGEANKKLLRNALAAYGCDI